MTKGEAAPAAMAEPASRNLLLRVVAALVLAPAAIAIAYAGGGLWAALVTLGVVHTGLMYVLLYGAIQKLPTAMTGALSFIYPIAAIVVDWIAFGHRLGWLQWLGVVAILLAAAGLQRGWWWPRSPRASACPER